MSKAGGFILVLGAIILNGSFLAPFKRDQISSLNVSPMVFQWYNSLGILLSSFLIQAFLPLNSKFVSGAADEFHFCLLALLSGALIMVSICCSFVATHHLGMALAQGVFSGAAIVASFLWGVLAFGEDPSNIMYSILGLVLIIAGVFVIALSPAIAQRLFGRPMAANLFEAEEEPRLSSSLFIEGSIVNIDPGRVSPPHSSSSSTNTASPKSFPLGVLWAIVCGVAGGSFLVPLHYVPASQQGLAFLPAFGVAAAFTSCVFLGLQFTSSQPPDLHLRQALLSGTLSGVIWNINNVCSIGAIPILGYSLAFPLSQCAVFVSGLWGIFVYKEIAGKAILVFFIGSSILIGGAILLSFGQS